MSFGINKIPESLYFINYLSAPTKLSLIMDKLLNRTEKNISGGYDGEKRLSFLVINCIDDNRDNNHGISILRDVLMVKKDRDIVTWIVVIGVILYILWYISTHSPEVTLGEVLTIWGGTLLIFSWLLDRTTKNIEKYIDLKFNTLKEKLENLKTKKK